MIKNNQEANNQDNIEHSTSDTACTQELEILKDKLRYLMAEFDNYKKRTEKERLDWMENARTEVLTDILDLSDDFDRALSFIGSTDPVTVSPEKSLQDGLILMHKTLNKIFKKYKVEEIEFSKNFDPVKQEAIMQISSPEHASGQVVKILQKGFICKNNILRPAKVAVAE